MEFSGREGEWGGIDREPGSGGGHGAAAPPWGEQLPSAANTPPSGTASPVDVAGFAEGKVEDRIAVAFSTSPAATPTVAGVDLGNVGDRTAVN